MAKYSKKIVERITELIRSDSYTIAEICQNVGLSKDTYYRWLKEKSDFSDAIKKAQEEFDEFLVAEAKKSMIKKVRGYTVNEEKTIYANKTEFDDEGNPINKPVIKEKTIIKKHFQPDPAMIIFALTNKASDEYKNKQVNELTGKDGKDIIAQVSIVPMKEAKQTFASKEDDVEK